MIFPDSQVNQEIQVLKDWLEAMDNLVEMASPVNRVIQDRMVIVAHQEEMVNQADKVWTALMANAAMEARATIVHRHVPHPDTTKPSVYAVKQHCQSHRCQRIVDIAMVGCWDDMILS